MVMNEGHLPASELLWVKNLGDCDLRIIAIHFILGVGASHPQAKKVDSERAG